MPGIARKTDTVKCEACNHKKQCCAAGHVVTGPITSTSPNVFANGLAVARIDDAGMSFPCCGQNKFVITAGSNNVFVNGKKCARKDDSTKHCNGPGDGGNGKIIKGSTDVIVN